MKCAEQTDRFFEAPTIQVPTNRVAATRNEMEQAFQLVYESYLRSGLCRDNPHRMRVTPYHLLPTTTVFNAVLDDSVISTMTLIADGELGLPMESMYGELVAQRRAEGIRIGEVSCLADRRASHKRFMEIFYKLSRLLGQFARFHGLDQILIVVHPRHAPFYQRFLKFEPVGGLTACPHVENNPAVALCLDFAHVDRTRPTGYDSYFGIPISADRLQRPVWSPDYIERLGTLVDDCFEQVLIGDSYETEHRFCTV